jgi:hypothetical protein
MISFREIFSSTRPLVIDNKSANSVAKNIFKYLNEDKVDFDEYGWRVNIEALKPNSHEKQDKVILVQLKESLCLNRYICGAISKYEDIYFNGEIYKQLYIYLYINIKNNKPENLEEEIYSILIHEFTHVTDIVDKKDSDFQINKEKYIEQFGEESYYKKYYNLRSEFKAFLQQIVNDFFKQNELKDIKNMDEFIDNGLKKSKTYNRIINYIDERKKKIIKIVIYKILNKNNI